MTSCSNNNYTISKKPICKELMSKNKFIILCDENKELYHLRIKDINKSLFKCYKKDFNINLNGQIKRETFLKCHSQYEDKNFIFFY